MLNLLGSVFFCATLAFAQTAPRFEVASIRKSSDDSMRMTGRTGGPGTTSPNQITWRFKFTGSLVMEAYGVPSTRFKGPERIMYGSTDTAWDVQATLPEGSTAEDVPKMLQTLLLERFGIKVHWETEERAIYRMTVAKGGVKVKLGENDGGRSFSHFDRAPGGGTLMHTLNSTLQDVARLAESNLGEKGAIVQDETGLTGYFTADLTFDNFKTALEQDWGLKLERGKGPVQVLVVDEIREEPTEN